MTHLWEAEHPYYAREGNFYTRPGENHDTYESWDDFMAEEGDADPELNLVYRWDWVRPNPDDYEDGEEMDPEVVKVFWVNQGKAILRSAECHVTEADEPAVRTWLTDRAHAVTAIWEPISLTKESS